MKTASPTKPPAATESAPARQEFRILELSRIRPSKTNPRRTFDQAALAELTDNVKKQGVLQPILVRRSGDDYELIAGERRYRAAKAAGLTKIPSTILDVTEAQALEIQVIENLHRADVHPLEEGEGYQLLIKKHGYQVADLAAKVQKSTSYVFHRLALARLSPKVKAFLLKEEISLTEAEVIGRIQEHDKQEEVLKERWDDITDLRRLIENEYQLELSKAAWNLDDAQLVPAAGPCSSCPKRSSAQGDLFGAGKRDFCLDRACWKGKATAQGAKLSEKYKADGKKVYTGAAAETVLKKSGTNSTDQLHPVNATVDLGYEWSYKRVPVRDTIKGKDVETILAIDVNGRPHELIYRNELVKLVPKPSRDGSSGRGSTGKVSEKDKAKRRQRLLELKAVRTVWPKFWPPVIQKLASKPLHGKTLREFLAVLIEYHGNSEMVNPACDRMKVPAGQYHFNSKKNLLKVAKAVKSDTEALAILWQMVMGMGIGFDDVELSAATVEVVRLAGADYKAAVAAEVDVLKKAKKAKAAGKGGKS